MTGRKERCIEKTCVKIEYNRECAVFELIIGVAMSPLW